MTPLAAQIVADALASCPVQTRDVLVRSNFPTHKVERLRSSYTRIIRKADEMAKSVENADLAFPRLFAAAGLSKQRLPRLDYNVLIAPTLLDAWYKEVSDADRLSAFAGVPMARERAAGQSVVYRRAALNALSARGQELAFRIQEALLDGGYPVFWTLTVDPEHEHIIAPRRDEFRLWLRQLRKRFGDFQYCCVVERGGLGRLHYHSLFIFADLSCCTDPNALIPGGKRLEIPQLRGFWPYGLSNPVAVRYSPTDVYGRLGWRWPKGRKTGAPVAVALYMAKYLTKSTDEVNGCRTKMSRNFGLRRLMEMSPSHALLILLGDPDPFLQHLVSQGVNLSARPPLSIMKRFAAQKLFGALPRLPLPVMKTGSVSLAAQRLARAKSTPMSAGDSINPGAGFKNCLDPYRQPISSVEMGAIT